MKASESIQTDIMPFMKRSGRALIAVVLALVASSIEAQTKPTRIMDDVVPGTEWQSVSPESVGYSNTQLEALRAWVKTQDTMSMMIVSHGRVIFSYGDVSHASKIASVRKSVLGMLQGAYSAMGAGGTFITVFPGWDTVVVHQVDIDKNPKAQVMPSSYMAMLAMLMNSYCGDECK
jgi:hypothetical protein